MPSFDAAPKGAGAPDETKATHAALLRDRVGSAELSHDVGDRGQLIVCGGSESRPADGFSGRRPNLDDWQAEEEAAIKAYGRFVRRAERVRRKIAESNGCHLKIRWVGGSEGAIN